MLKNQIILIRKVEEAMAFATFLKNKDIPFATVEAEYGDICVEGSWETLAHHTRQYRDFPAPCVRRDIKPMAGGIILISHLDLDTIGGIMLLEGRSNMEDSFWESEALIDTQGVLAEQQLTEEDRFLMRAYWSWETNLPDQVHLSNQTNHLLDVTDCVELRINFIEMMLKESKTPFETKVLNQWYEQFQSHLDSFLKTCVFDSDQLRVFISEENPHYLSHLRDNQLIETCITLNQHKGTLTLSDISGTIDCKEVMQTLFGPNAGGQFRVAGSPRDEIMDTSHLKKLMGYLMEKKGLEKKINFD